MTMFQENYLTKYFNILEYQKFFEYVVKLIEQGIKLGITIALSFANVPFAREIAEIIRKAITTAIKWISGKLALPSYYPFGFLYQLRSNCGQGIRAVTTAKEVIKLFTPPPLSDITEANVLLHSLNSYFVQFVSALPTGQTNTIPQQVALTADDFYNLDKTVASSSHRSVTEVNIKFSCRNPELIYHVIDPKSNLVSLPLLQQPEGNSMETMVSLSFVSRILNGLTPGDEFVVYAKPLFGDDVEIRCICPPLLDSPGNSYASLTLNQVVETSYYRILLMATVVNVNIEEQALISPEHSKQILQTLEAMDTLVNLVGLHQFLKFPKQTREKLENGAYDLPGKEGEASIQATANHVANLLEEAAMIPQFNESLSNDLLNSEIITLKRIVEISKRKRSNFNLPSELNSYLDAIAQKDIFGLIPNTSTYLPSNIHTALQTSSDTDSEELFTRARIALAVIDSLLIPNYEATIRRLNLVMQLSWVLKPAISLLPILDIQINEKKTWENIFNSDVKERNIVYLVVFSSIRIDSVFYSILPKIIMKSFFGLLAYFLPDDLIPVNFDEADLFGMETILSDRLTRVLGIRFLDQSFDEALDYYGTQDSAGRNLLQKLQELVEKDRYNIWNFMRALVYVHQLRTYLENSFFVGVIGTARLGKSRLIADLFHAETSHGPEDIHITRGVTSYAAKQKIGNDLKTIQGMYVIDFPGMDDVANLSKQMFRQGISAIDVFIVILEGKKPHLQSPMEILKQITELDMDLPILICLHRADEWAMNLDRGNKTLTAEAFKEQVKKVEKLLITNCKKYGIHPDALNRIAKVVPTCFDLQAKDYKDVLINSGVWDVVDVYRWLKMNPNIPPLWKDRLPDTWQFQTWKMDRTNTIN